MPYENVVALPGYQVPQLDREPVPAVVTVLEKLLAEAMAGEIVGIAYATARAAAGDKAEQLSSGAGWEHGANAKNALVVAASMLDYRIKQSLVGEE